MKVVILAAGQGRRLLPWTHHRPKCLLPFAGRSLLAWQLRILAAAGVTQAVVVTGFGADMVEDEIARERPDGLAVETVYNPFFSVADNIASCWAARAHLTGEVAIVNGDTLFDPAMLGRLRTGAHAPVSIATATKTTYDADDVKVQVRDGRVKRIGKTLAADATDAEWVGLLWLAGTGGALLTAAVDTVMRQPRGVSRWLVAALDDLAARDLVAPVSMGAQEWTEVDYPGDLGRAEMLARGWMHDERRQRAALVMP